MAVLTASLTLDPNFHVADAIGPAESRPERVDLAWQRASIGEADGGVTRMVLPPVSWKVIRLSTNQAGNP